MKYIMNTDTVFCDGKIEDFIVKDLHVFDDAGNEMIVGDVHRALLTAILRTQLANKDS